MRTETAEQHETLTPEQVQTVERARNTPFVSSRSRRRSADVTGWSFKPPIEAAREIDVVELLDRDQDADLRAADPLTGEE